MSKVGEHYREKEEMGLVGGYEDYPKESKGVKSARKKLERAKRKRDSRKTPYPVGFEYKKGKND